jgi:hypothetical protein
MAGNSKDHQTGLTGNGGEKVTISFDVKVTSGNYGESVHLYI